MTKQATMIRNLLSMIRYHPELLICDDLDELRSYSCFRCQDLFTDTQLAICFGHAQRIFMNLHDAKPKNPNRQLETLSHAVTEDSLDELYDEQGVFK